MLDSTTKRNIDAARNVLVGKVPDPKAQVEQITTALIYKFMDDMDKESVELGGESTFFTGEYEKYRWTNVIDTKLSGEGRLDLYVQAISSMSRNPNLPQLFRDIFKDAFLPYRDPQTLSLFLKEINKFNYDHSEELGNSFEYLLSVLGSQGDAGQFRTPRHIIDFIVEVVNPQKTDAILDPACGTAGFLISAYKHIRKHNSSNYIPEKDTVAVIGETAAEMIITEKEVFTGDLLTPTERKKLTKNIRGYDISPDMVKLSLVNLYLHGFTSPKIYEYDTLTSEKHWDDAYDVILANPPFMTPKGGIRPHKRFQVQARRSEVLFVDYILEHLNINGRAGIIVPEGIVFKSDKAYKKLRKLLVDDGLFAVVSLPSGVFNPYAGVKTCILFFDNQVAKKTDEILFIKIENDGFDLGAQRRAIKENDLPEALKIVSAWKQSGKQESKLALWVKKEKIAEDGDYNLTGERYKKTGISEYEKWPVVQLKSVCKTIQDGDWIESKDQSLSGIRLVQTGNVGFGEYLDKSDKSKYVSEETFKRLNCKEVLPGDILVSRLPDPVGRACIIPDLKTKMITAVDCTIIRVDKSIVLPKYLLYLTKSSIYHKEVKQYLTGSSRKRISRKNLEKVLLPLPPLEVQQEIVAQIEVKQVVLDGAKAVIENLEKERRYFGHELLKMEDVEWVELGEVCEIARGGSPRPIKEFLTESADGINWIKIGDVAQREKYITSTKEKIKPAGISKTRLVSKGDLLLSNSMSYGRPYILDIDGAIHDGWLLLRLKKENLLKDYLFYILGSELTKNQFERLATGGVVKNLNSKLVSNVKIPIPSKDIQEILVIEAEHEEKIIRSNLEIIGIMEKKIDKVLEEI